MDYKEQDKLLKKYNLSLRDLENAGLCIIDGILIKDRIAGYNYDDYNAKISEHILIACETETGYKRVYRYFDVF